jgi:tetratricopeptide (TPR) repeat protein
MLLSSFLFSKKGRKIFCPLTFMLSLKGGQTPPLHLRLRIFHFQFLKFSISRTVVFEADTIIFAQWKSSNMKINKRELFYLLIFLVYLQRTNLYFNLISMKKANSSIAIGILFCFTILLCPANNNNTRTYYEKLSKLYQQATLNRNYSKSMEYLTEMRTLAEKNNWKDLQIEALNDMGLLYTDIFDYDKAMDCYMTSYDIAIKESSIKGQIIALNNIGRQFALEKEYDKSKEYVKKAYDIACKWGDSLRIGQIAMNIAASANETGELDTATKYIDISLNMLKNQSNIIGLSHARTVKIETLYLKQQYDEAEQLALITLEQFSEKQIDDIKAQFLLFFSKIYEKKGQLQKAIHVANEALNNYPQLMNKIEIYKHLSELYLEMNMFSLAMQYKDSIIITKDSLAKINERDRALNTQIKIDLLRSEKELTHSKLKQKTERILFISIISFISILSLIIVWLFRVQLSKNKQNKIISENNRKIIELELEQEKHKKILLEQQLKEQEVLVLLEQERLNNEIEVKNRQLTAKAISESNRIELFEEVIHILSEIPKYEDNQVLRAVIQKLKAQRNESLLDDFLSYFEQINPIFLNTLKEKHPDLSANDIRILSYFYLNLSTKEIASLLNILPDSLKKKKQRLACKLGVETTDLYSYLVNLI